MREKDRELKRRRQRRLKRIKQRAKDEGQHKPERAQGSKRAVKKPPAPAEVGAPEPAAPSEEVKGAVKKKPAAKKAPAKTAAKPAAKPAAKKPKAVPPPPPEEGGGTEGGEGA